MLGDRRLIVRIGYNYVTIMAKFKEGNLVQVKSREATAEEAKNGRYAPYLGNATGSVLKAYSAQEVAVKIDLNSLDTAVQERHQKQQEAMQQKWLDSLSEEARNRLTAEEKTLRLNYVVLLAESDLMPYKEGKRPPTAKPTNAPAAAVKPTAERIPASASKTVSAKPAAPLKESPAKASAAKGAETETKAAAKPKKSADTSTSAAELPKRKTSEELDAIEEQYLKARKRS